MSKQIAQIRYYSEGSPKNQPVGLTMRRLTSGSIFSDILPITQLGIQSLPGMKFYLNNSTSPVIIGSTGIYELDLEGLAEITNLSFSAESLNLINANPSSYLIVDIIYDKEDN